MKCESCQKEMVREEGAHRISYMCPSCTNSIIVESCTYSVNNIVKLMSKIVEANTKRMISPV
jgi:hypothetical protein